MFSAVDTLIIIALGRKYRFGEEARMAEIGYISIGVQGRGESETVRIGATLVPSGFELKIAENP